MKYKNTWDLDAVIPGGTKSPELQEKLRGLKEEIGQYKSRLDGWAFSKDPSPEPFKAILKKQEEIEKGLSQSATFVQMWHDAYMDDDYANVVMGQIMDLYSEMQKLGTTFQKNWWPFRTKTGKSFYRTRN